MNESPLVLIVDDARDNREAYAEYLRFHGFRTIEAANGQEALKESARWNPDVILLDLRLPDMDGVDVSRRIRSSGARPRIIALSACVFQPDVDAAMEGGCDAFLAKPCLPGDVVKEIRRVLEIPKDRERPPMRPLHSQMAAGSGWIQGAR
jgi:two-component system cell cycle response regulator DivK